MKKILWFLFAFFGVCIGLYPLMYWLGGAQTGVLGAKPAVLLGSTWWRLGFYSHISFGGLALLVGWAQFSRQWRARRLDLHRLLGKVYVVSALIGALSGIGVGFVAEGGTVAQTGFVLLGIIWFTTTGMAFLKVKNGDIGGHERMMVWSYAACFAAVTLRIWLPLLIVAHNGAFIPAYRIVAWLCWVPNMGVAWWWVRRMASRG